MKKRFFAKVKSSPHFKPGQIVEVLEEVFEGVYACSNGKNIHIVIVEDLEPMIKED